MKKIIPNSYQNLKKLIHIGYPRLSPFKPHLICPFMVSCLLLWKGVNWSELHTLWKCFFYVIIGFQVKLQLIVKGAFTLVICFLQIHFYLFLCIFFKHTFDHLNTSNRFGSREGSIKYWKGVILKDV